MMTPEQERKYEELQVRLALVTRRRTPGRVEFRSRLVGGQRVWTDHAGREVIYAQLPEDIRDAYT